MTKICDILKKAHAIAIAGHKNPDGDCVGSCMGLYHYLKDNFGIEADVFLEDFAEPMRFIADIDRINPTADPEKPYDLFFALDCADKERIGAGAERIRHAERVACIDHHVTNLGYGDVNIIYPGVSSASEVLFSLLDEEKISKSCAECLYMGIVHDTGVFQYSNVTSETMRIAGALIDKKIAFYDIITKTFVEKTYAERKISSYAFEKSKLLEDGRLIWSWISLEEMEAHQVKKKNLNGIVESLRNTTGVEASAFFYEQQKDVWKVSMRSKSRVDVSEISVKFGGGGHIRAAGCTIAGKVEEVADQILGELAHSFKAE